MFRSVLGDFEEDPFFRDHHASMAPMMNPFGDPFLRSFGFPALGDPRHAPGTHHPNQQLAAPTDMFSSMFMNMNSMMQNMQRNFHQMANDPNAYSYTSSSVMSYSSDGRSEPKVFQASKSTKNAPGGVRETHHAVRDSESGLQRMAIGHHLDDRSHVIERSVNRRSGEEERKQDFINLDEADAQVFNQEWQQRTRQPTGALRDRRRDVRRALEDPMARPPSHSRHPGLEAHHRRDHTHAARGDFRGQMSHREPNIREQETDHGAARDRDWGRDDLERAEREHRQAQNRERKVRVNSRPRNKHEPRGGL